MVCIHRLYSLSVGIRHFILSPTIMSPRPEMRPRPSYLEAVPDPVRKPEEFKLFSLKDDLRKEISALSERTSLHMKDITDDVVDVVALSKIDLASAIVCLERAKHAADSEGEALLVAFRRFVADAVRQ